MAHRKPIGSLTLPMIFDWEGGNPELGDYLVSAAGTWYLVAGELETRNPKKVRLVLERIDEPLSQSIGTTVHPFYWYPARQEASRVRRSLLSRRMDDFALYWLPITGGLTLVIYWALCALVFGAASTPHPRTRTVRTHCIAVAAPNGVIRFGCTVTLPPRVRLTGGSLIYVEVKGP